MSTASSPVAGPDWGLIGQDRVVASLQRAVLDGPRHAYIVTGPSHSGKRTLALAFAKALNCLEPPEAGAFCERCSPCRRIDRGSFPDVIHADLDTQLERERGSGRNLALTIATVRQVTSQLALRPTESRWRVVVIDDVESMQETAQEAFLKTLEEPPSYAVLLLLTTDTDLLLPTVRSRCVTVRMQAANARTLAAALSGRGVGDARAMDIASRSDGRAGWAITAAADPALLDRVAGEAGELTGWIESAPYARLLRAWELADVFARDREAVYGTLQAVQRHWRQVLHRRHGLAGPGFDGEGGVAFEGANEATDLAIAGALQAVDTCIADLEANVRPRLALQAMVLAWPEARR